MLECARRIYRAAEGFNVFVRPTVFLVLFGSEKQVILVPGVLSEVRQEEGNKQRVNQVDEEGAHQRNDDESQM